MNYRFNRSLARHIRTNLDLVFIRRSQLEDDQISDQSYTWEVVGRSPDPESEFHNGFHKSVGLGRKDWFLNEFSKRVYQECVNQFLSIDPRAVIKDLERCVLSLSNSAGGMTDADKHRDFFDLNRWTFLLHLKGTSGNTDFLDSEINPAVIKTVEFEPGNLIIFPSVYMHQAHLPSDHNNRYIVNTVLEIDTELSDQVLAKSPALQKIVATTKR